MRDFKKYDSTLSPLLDQLPGGHFEFLDVVFNFLSRSTIIYSNTEFSRKYVIKHFEKNHPDALKLEEERQKEAARKARQATFPFSSLPYSLRKSIFMKFDHYQFGIFNECSEYSREMCTIHSSVKFPAKNEKNIRIVTVKESSIIFDEKKASFENCAQLTIGGRHIAANLKTPLTDEICYFLINHIRGQFTIIGNVSENIRCSPEVFDKLAEKIKILSWNYQYPNSQYDLSDLKVDLIGIYSVAEILSFDAKEVYVEIPNSEQEIVHEMEKWIPTLKHKVPTRQFYGKHFTKESAEKALAHLGKSYQLEKITCRKCRITNWILRKESELAVVFSLLLYTAEKQTIIIRAYDGYGSLHEYPCV